MKAAHTKFKQCKLNSSEIDVQDEIQDRER